MIHDQEKVDAELRTLLESGMNIGDALRLMHEEQYQGHLFLVPAVITVTGMDKFEAQQLVVREVGIRRA